MKKASILLGLCMGVLLITSGCQNSKDNSQATVDVSTLPTFTVTSTSINNDGRLLKATANSGDNKSPQLEWESQENVSCYAIYMYDISAGNWMHMKLLNITDTSLDLGYCDSSSYIGPYPPSGSGDHTYKVVVYALKEAADETPGYLDNECNIEKIESALDTHNGESGNIISTGSIEGMYKSGDSNN